MDYFWGQLFVVRLRYKLEVREFNKTEQQPGILRLSVLHINPKCWQMKGLKALPKHPVPTLQLK